MRLENFLGLTGAKLRNTPSISRIYHFSTDAKQVHRGDLFFASDPKSVEDAIANGAYAIVCEAPIPMSDPEIAWIETENLEQAMLRTLRYLLLEKKCKRFALGDIELDIARLVVLDPAWHFYSSLPQAIEALQAPTLEAFAAPHELFARLALQAETLDATPLRIEQEYLFATSLHLFDTYYERLPISPLFVHALGRVATLVRRFDLAYNLWRLQHFRHFRPHFIDSNFHEVEFGKTQRVIITEPTCHLLGLEHEFLMCQAPWAKKLFVQFSCRQSNFATISLEKIAHFLYNADFHFALCEEFDLSTLARKREERRLL